MGRLLELVMADLLDIVATIAVNSPVLAAIAIGLFFVFAVSFAFPAIMLLVKLSRFQSSIAQLKEHPKPADGIRKIRLRPSMLEFLRRCVPRRGGGRSAAGA